MKFRKLAPLAVVAVAPLLAISSGAYAQQGSEQQNYGQEPSNQQNPGMQSAQQTTSICHFTSGSRAGSTVDFSATPGVAAVPVGSHCADMTGSNGVAVAKQSSRAPGAGRFYRTPEAPVGLDRSGQPAAGYTLSCRYSSGPSAGSTRDFTGVLGATPIRIGSPCSDGANKGVGVAAGS